MTLPIPVIDYSEVVNQVRALIPDVERLPNPANPNADAEYMFTDEHLQALLNLNAGNIRLTAADACEVLGTSEAIIAKVIKTEDLQTDGAKVMGQFLARSKQLRAYALESTNDDVDGFDIVPYVVPPANIYYWLGE